tara:strand:+ start:1233 stop:2072 length:840 start_codon:yes stop_codon:yes gene_type:complete
MKKTKEIKAIELKIKVQDKLIKEGYVSRDEIHKNRDQSQKDQLMEYFGEVLTESGDEMNVSRDRVEFRRIDPTSTSKWKKEILTLYFKSKDWRSSEINQIDTSFYSTSDNSLFELQRMLLIGKVGEILIDHSDDIIAGHNKITSDYAGTLRKAEMAVQELELVLRAFGKEIEDIENKVIQDKIDTGCVEFKMRDDNPRTLPNLDIRWDWDLNNIQKIEILSKTASGLSANIKVKRCFKQYDYDNEDEGVTKLIYQEDTFDKVRMSKINHMISWNKEIIV